MFENSTGGKASLSHSVAEYIRQPSLVDQLTERIWGHGETASDLVGVLRTIDRPLLNYTYGAWSELVEASVDIPKAKDGWLESAASEDFENPGSILQGMSVVGDVSSLVERHVAVLSEAIGLIPEPALFQMICEIHAYFCSYFNLVDSHFDGHMMDADNVLNAGLLLSATYKRLCKLAAAYPAVAMGHMTTRISRSLEIQKKALVSERGFSEAPFVRAQEDERSSVVGRADCVFVTAELIAALRESAIEPPFRSGLEEYVVLSQLADDLGDWREDFERGRYSSFLRECFARYKTLPDIASLERTVYIGGFYEKRLATVIRGMSALIDDFRAIARPMPLTASVLVAERKKLFSVFRAFVAAKQKHCKAAAA